MELRVGDRLQNDFVMQVGGVSEQITVTSGVQQIETATADLSQVIGAKSTSQLPLLGRNPFQLITVASGVQHTPALASRSDRPFDNGGMDSYNINGSRTFTNEFLLDGTPDNSSEGAPSSIPGRSVQSDKHAVVRCAEYSSQFAAIRTGDEVADQRLAQSATGAEAVVLV